MTLGIRAEDAGERLYALLPAHIRTTDARNGWALRALFEVFASGSVEIDAEIDTLLDSMFVETAPEAALDDLAALVASEPLRRLPPESGFSPRAFIANTVRYRRGKGTARVLEALAADVGGLGTVAVEYFQRLARLQHLIDVRPERPTTALLRPPETRSAAGTARDRLPRLVDVRSIARAGGRHHVPNVGAHILRPSVRSYAAPATVEAGTAYEPGVLAGVPVARPWPVGGVTRAGYFQLAAQPGRVLRLFNPDRRSETSLDRVVETDLPDRLRRLPLHLETDALRGIAMGRPGSAVAEPRWFDEAGQPFAIFLRSTGSTDFNRVAPAEIRIANLDDPPAPAGARPAATLAATWMTEGTATTEPVATPGSATIRCGFDPMTGRLIVAEPAAGEADVAEVRVAHAVGLGWAIGAGAQDRNTIDVPFDVTDSPGLRNFVRIVDATRPESGVPGASVRNVKTLAKAVAEWNALGNGGTGMRGLIVLTRCDRGGAAGGAANLAVEVHPDSELHIVSAQWRPRVAKPGVPVNVLRHGYLVRRDRRFTVDAPIRVSASVAPTGDQRPGSLVLDGLELTEGMSLAVRAVSRLFVRHCTIRNPGGTALATTAPLEGADVVVERTLIGRIDLEVGAAYGTGRLALSSSLVGSDDGPGDAIAARGLDGRLRNVTVLGTSAFRSLEATNVIFESPTIVTRRQAGCVRFSWIPPGSSVPRRFRCQPDLAVAAEAERRGADLTVAERDAVALGVTPLFLDDSFDEPTVAMLHPLTPDAIRLGGEEDAEMGAFSAAAMGLRVANLTSLFDDYVPFGLEAGVIDDTRSSAVAQRRNRP